MPRSASLPTETLIKRVVQKLHDIEQDTGEGTITLGRNQLSLSNLGKTFFPKDRYTKGDVMRYYATVARDILPVLKDRPLVMKRYPNGINGKCFFQQKAPEHSPDGLRTSQVRIEGGTPAERVIGGDLYTLLYLVQLGVIEMHPWHARVQSIDSPDYTIIDLDPGPGVTFRKVIDVARWVKETIDKHGISATIKTSGATGMHITIPLPRRSSEKEAVKIAQVIAEDVAKAHPKQATVARAVKDRPAGTVYVDYMQNITGKSVASTYSIRARDGATVSMPLEWGDIKPGLDPRDFTIENFL